MLYTLYNKNKNFQVITMYYFFTHYIYVHTFISIQSSLVNRKIKRIIKFLALTVIHDTRKNNNYP